MRPRRSTRLHESNTGVQTDVQMSSNTLLETSVPAKRKKPPEINSTEDVSRGGKVRVTINSRTSRDRLLELLNEHVSRKKPRVRKSSTKVKGPSKRIKSRPPLKTPEDDLAVPESTTNFTQYPDSQLRNMLLSVGLETEDLDRDALIQNCKTYDALIVLPKPSSLSHKPNRSTSKLKAQGEGSKFDFSFRVLRQEADQRGMYQVEPSTSTLAHLTQQHEPVLGDNESRHNLRASSSMNEPTITASSSMNQPTILASFTVNQPTITTSSSSNSPVASTSRLPSLENPRCAHPRPRPTRLAHGQSANPQGKKTLQPNVHSESEYEPGEDEAMKNKDDRRKGKDLDTGLMESDQQEESDVGLAEDGTSGGEEVPPKACTTGSCGELMAKMTTQMSQTNRRVDQLTSELESLTDLVRSLIGKENKSASPQKTLGGRTSDRVHFHINTMLGISSVEDLLPNGAGEDEQEGWNLETDVTSLNIDENRPLETNESADRSFPGQNGPSHPNATPRQLLLIRQLMNQVNVKSFRPGFGISQTIGRNKWLWSLCRHIFIRLVECGVYGGISLEKKNLDYIDICFSKYIDTLQKRFRTQRWTSERQVAAATQTRQKTRLSYTRRTRSAVAQMYRELWPLLEVIKAAASDAETDPEDATTPQKGRRCLVCELRWRSPELEGVFIRLDSLKNRLDQSIPSTSSNASPRGRPSRPRIRSEPRPTSRIAAPDGLYEDCYSEGFLAGLSAGEKQLRCIKPKQILPTIIAVLDKLEQNMMGQ
ncbi:hypothetical protein DFH28DRAFT_930145 [Melampsora americana]|nr:hypothetical protein DFH28DRAFT_930145 [Melampsora americana]